MSFGREGLVAGSFLAVMGIAGLVVFPLLYTSYYSLTRPSAMYWAAVDANPDGMRVKIYLVHFVEEAPRRRVEEIWRCDFDPVDPIVRPKTIRANTEECAKSANVPKDISGLESIPVIARGTSSYRPEPPDPIASSPDDSNSTLLLLQQVEEPTRAQLQVEGARLKRTLEKVGMNVRSARVLGPRDAVVLKWLAINHDAFRRNPSTALNSGLIDLGGLNADIAYSGYGAFNDDATGSDDEDDGVVDRYSKARLVSESFPCLGLDAVLVRHYANLIQEALATTNRTLLKQLEIFDPCLQSDSSPVLLHFDALADIFRSDHPCISTPAKSTFEKVACPPHYSSTSGSEDPECLSRVLLSPMRHGDEETTADAEFADFGENNVTSSSVMRTCLIHTEFEFFDDDVFLSADPFPDHHPPALVPFVLAADSLKFPELVGSLRVMKETTLLGLREEFCNTPFNQLKTEYFALNDHTLREACFYYAFSSLLLERLGFAEESFGAMKLVSRGVNTTDADVMNETFWYASKMKSYSTVGVVLFVVSLLLAFAMILLGGALMRPDSDWGEDPEQQKPPYATLPSKLDEDGGGADEQGEVATSGYHRLNYDPSPQRSFESLREGDGRRLGSPEHPEIIIMGEPSLDDFQSRRGDSRLQSPIISPAVSTTTSTIISKPGTAPRDRVFPNPSGNTGGSPFIIPRRDSPSSRKSRPTSRGKFYRTTLPFIPAEENLEYEIFEHVDSSDEEEEVESSRQTPRSQGKPSRDRNFEPESKDSEEPNQFQKISERLPLSDIKSRSSNRPETYENASDEADDEEELLDAPVDDAPKTPANNPLSANSEPTRIITSADLEEEIADE